MIDKRLLVDTVTISLENGKDDWGSPIYGEPFVLSFVRFDRNLETFGDKNKGSRASREFNKPGVIYIYPDYCDVNVDNSWINAKVSDEFGEYLIQKIIPNKHPFLNKVFSYEIEVI